MSTEKETAVLAVPESCTDRIVTLYHKSLFAGHQGVVKTYLTINDKFFIPNLIHYLISYIKGHHLCQLACNEKPPPRQYQTRINPNYVPMSRLSMDLKVMPRSHKGHKYVDKLIFSKKQNKFLLIDKLSPDFHHGFFQV